MTPEHNIENVVHVYLLWDFEKDAWTLDPWHANTPLGVDHDVAICSIHERRCSPRARDECLDLCNRINEKPPPTLADLHDLLTAHFAREAADG